jgi:uncharacterized protein YbjT (DUF2867 family)
MKLVIIGGTGRIGSKLVTKLRAKNAQESLTGVPGSRTRSVSMSG